MPIYEYECPKCHNKQEEYHPISSDPTILCVDCGTKCERNISPCVVRVEGSNTSFDYKAHKALRKAQDERSHAESNSHMGSDPYGYLEKNVPSPDIVDSI